MAQNGINIYNTLRGLGVNIYGYYSKDNIQSEFDNIPIYGYFIIDNLDFYQKKPGQLSGNWSANPILLLSNYLFKNTVDASNLFVTIDNTEISLQDLLDDIAAKLARI